MKSKIKELIARSLTFTERSLGVKPPKVTVLLMHSVSADGTLVDIKKSNFIRLIQYLRLNFDFMTLDEVTEFIKGNYLPSRPSVALTFDDGYEDVIKNVIPTLKKYSIPATFFVTADPENIKRSELRNDKRILSLKDISLVNDNLFTIASHTMTHPDLSSVSLDLGIEEMEISKKILSTITKSKVKYFAYPKGLYTNEIVESAGKIYEASFSAKPGIINSSTDLNLISRIGVDRTINSSLYPGLFTYWIIFYFQIKPRLINFYSEIIGLFVSNPGVIGNVLQS